MPDKDKEKKYMNVLYATTDENTNDIIDFTSGEKMKITCFFAPKFTSTESRFSFPACIKLEYQKDIKQIRLIDRLDNIGLSGYIDITNAGSYLNTVLERHDNYYCIINFTKYEENGASVKFEPYIFDISFVENISSPEQEHKLLRLGLTDYMTGILKTHSMASLMKFCKEIPQMKNYKDIFSYILWYIKEYVKINTNNKYELKKDLLYNSSVLCNSETLNGYDINNDMSELISCSLGKIPRNATIYEGLKILLTDCATSMQTKTNFKNNYTEIGDVLIPFFFKEEYTDENGIYPMLWTDSTDGKDFIDLNYGGKSEFLYLRNMTMRDIYMPFHLCFNQVENKQYVWEIINPNENSTISNRYVSLSTITKDNITALQFDPIDMNTVRKRWKNMIFLSSSENGSAVECTLIFFDWFYKYFENVFLNSGDNGIYNYASNVIPTFYMLSKNENIGQAKSSNEVGKNNTFDEYNAYTVATETNDTVKECLREMGKNISSFILLNDSYTFRLRGNLLRRPNEIIKFSTGHSKEGDETSLSFHANLLKDNYALLYVRSITHDFIGNEYTNIMTTSKIIEPLAE